MQNLRQSVATRCAASLFVFALVFFSNGRSAAADEQVFIERDIVVIDLIQNVEWLRCSLGQIWDGKTCQGEIMKLNHDEIAQAIVQANDQVGGNWRLPSADELQALVCETCTPPKIDPEMFPNTSPEPYWTGERNTFTSENYYSINFYTGHKYGRFFKNQQLAVRLVRGR